MKTKILIISLFNILVLSSCFNLNNKKQDPSNNGNGTSIVKNDKSVKVVYKSTTGTTNTSTGNTNTGNTNTGSTSSEKNVNSPELKNNNSGSVNEAKTVKSKRLSLKLNGSEYEFTDKLYNFSVKFPNNKELVHFESEDKEPVLSLADSVTRNFLSFFIMKYEQNVKNFDDYFNNFMMKVNQTIKDNKDKADVKFSLLTNKKITLGGKSGHQVVVKIQQGDKTQILEQYLLPGGNGYAYAIVLLRSGDASPKILSIINSFKVLK